MPPDNPKCQFHPHLSQFSEIKGVNTESCEQGFRRLNQYFEITRKMTQYKRNVLFWFVNDSFNSDLERELKTRKLMWPNFTSSPVIDIKKRKRLQTCIHVVMSKILILSWYIKQSLSVSVLCYMIIKLLDWDLRMRVIHAWYYSLLFWNILFSRSESDTLISQFTTFSS